MQTKDLNKLVLNLKTPKITQDTLDDEVRGMFKNRKEGLDYINSQQWDNDEAKQNALDRLGKVYPRRVKGSSPEYTQRINSQYESVLPLLREKGYDVDNFTQEGIEGLLREFFEGSNKDEELQGLYKKGAAQGNELWNKKYKPTFDALMTAYDKYYNDYWQANAPMGYEDD